MKRPPSDFKLLRAIYKRHRADYLADPTERQAEIALPIDIPAIAKDLGSDVHTVFGRLYYHLDPQYMTVDAKNGSTKHLFMPRLGNEANCINFPLLEALLAGLWQQRRRDLWTLWIAVVSLGVSIGSIVVAVATS